MFVSQVSRCDDLRPSDGVFSVRGRDRPGDFLQHIARRSGFPRRAIWGRVWGGAGFHPPLARARPGV